MRITFRATDDAQQIIALQALLFPADDRVRLDSFVQAWAGYDESDFPVAFCTARHWVSEGAVFLERAGVMPAFNGKGLQRRMIRLRERWARSIGAGVVLTYVAPKNYQSMVNLLRCGYRFYDPATEWAGPEMHYMERAL